MQWSCGQSLSDDQFNQLVVQFHSFITASITKGNIAYNKGADVKVHETCSNVPLRARSMISKLSRVHYKCTVLLLRPLLSPVKN